MDSNPGTTDTGYYVQRLIESKDNLINLRPARSKTKTVRQTQISSKPGLKSKIHKLDRVQDLEVKIQRAQEKTGARYARNMQPADKIYRLTEKRQEKLQKIGN